MEKKGVLVVGSANMDMVVKSDHFPQPGETILGLSFQMFPGGKGANQAVSSAKLGSDTYFLGCFGGDIFKDRLFEAMKADLVDLSASFINQQGHPTGIALITVDRKGENQIVVVSGSNMQLKPENIEERKDYFEKVRVVLTQLEIPLETVLRAASMAKEAGSIFILNPAPAAGLILPDELLQMTDYITPNKGELEVLTSTSISTIEDVRLSARKLIKKGVKNCIVTLGDKGALFISEKEYFEVSANKVKAVDTTGAGDAFTGAIASALSEGYDIRRAIEFANLAASISVTRMGAQSSMPSFEEVLELQKPV